MKPIQMVNLHTQYEAIKPEIDQAIAAVLDSTAFIKGKQVGQFENELAAYLNVKHVITCANGTDALMISLMALGLQPGDEVITPSFTFIATAETIAFLNLKPVFVDVEPNTFNISIDGIKKAITSKTKAIIPVHLFGQCANMTEIRRIAEKHKLFIIEDAAQSLGADYFYACGTPNKAGTLGTIGCTSFFPSKNLGCFGDGGAMFTNNDELAEKLRMISNHGMKVKYYHDCLGVNSRLDTIQAAILSVKLKYLNQYNQSRQKAAEYYQNALKGIKEIIIPEQSKFSTHIYHQYTLRISNGKRDALKQHLESNGIPIMIYYPVPLHLQKVFGNLNYKTGNLPISEQLCSEVLSLPMHTELSDDQLEFITTEIKNFKF
jgi:UDP-2-acetamido-2-deoxy-ribo-hexuluronate aminotransferase